MATKPPSKLAGCFLIGFALFWTTFVIAVDVMLATNAVHQLQATSFAKTSGRITQSEVTTSRGSKGRASYNIRIAYQYSVAGVTYTGTRYRSGTMGSSDRRWADSVVATFPTGSERTVFYDSERPGEALLRPGIEGSDLFMATFLTPFNLVMVVLWWSVPFHFKKPKTAPTAGGVTVFQDLSRTRARLSDISGIGVTLITIGSGAFVSIFVIAITRGFAPSLTFMAVTWIIILSAGIALGLQHHHRRKTGHFDLVLDHGALSVSLPATEGRKQRRTLGLNQVKSVDLETIPARKGSDTYKVILHTDGEGPAQEAVYQTSDETKAEGFAAWLRERLVSRRE